MKKNTLKGRIRTLITGVVMGCMLFSFVLTVQSRSSYAATGVCVAPEADVALAGATLNLD